MSVESSQVASTPESVPSPEAFRSVFRVYEVRRNEETLLYFGDPLVPREQLLETVWPMFHSAGYDVSLDRRTGEFVLVAEPAGESAGTDGVPWTNVALFVATVLSTLYAGTLWYYVFARYDLATQPWGLLDALPFTVAVMFVLGTHELGHYAMSRYHGVDATLPYFIPMVPPFGTMGAVIRIRGQIPDREALFDIGVAGPIAGLVATVIVTAVGLSLPPVAVPDAVLDSANTIEVVFGYPPLLELVARALGEPLSYPRGYVVNPVVIGGWLGMFVTLLNLLPVGQLDGGHVVRAILGDRQPLVAGLVPGALFVLAGYLYFVEDVGSAAGIWLFWGLLASVVAYLGPATTIDAEGIGWRRVVVGVLTLAAGLLCFTPVPINVVG